MVSPLRRVGVAVNVIRDQQPDGASPQHSDGVPRSQVRQVNGVNGDTQGLQHRALYRAKFR